MPWMTPLPLEVEVEVGAHVLFRCFGYEARVGRSLLQSPRSGPSSSLMAAGWKDICTLSGPVGLFVQMLPILCPRSLAMPRFSHYLMVGKAPWCLSGPSRFRVRFSVSPFGQLAILHMSLGHRKQITVNLLLDCEFPKDRITYK